MLFQVGAVDCESESKFCKEQEVQLFPKVLIYPFRAGGKSKPVSHTGDWTVKALKSFYNQQFSPLVTSLTHQNFVETMKKDQERPWAILVRKSKDLPVVWLATCGEFEKRIDCYDIRVRNGSLLLCFFHFLTFSGEVVTVSCPRQKRIEFLRVSLLSRTKDILN